MISKFLIMRNIKKEFAKEQHHNPDLSGKTIEELILEKYDRIMKGEEKIKFEPVSKVVEEKTGEDLDASKKEEDK